MIIAGMKHLARILAVGGLLLWSVQIDLLLDKRNIPFVQRCLMMERMVLFLYTLLLKLLHLKVVLRWMLYKRYDEEDSSY